MLESCQILAGASPPRASQILRPGTPALPPGVERYRVRGGRSTAVLIFAGDEITLTNIEGLQRCIIVAADERGRCDAGILGARANSRGHELEEAASRLRAALKDRRVGASPPEG